MNTLKENMLMQRCLEIARKGIGKVSPNPMVGCVIVSNKKIVGEGFHRQYGGPHAEIFALLQAGRKAKGATMFVNLEPCVHFGKTPPCVDAIIRSGISKVVIAVKDPNPFVSGRGVGQLREAGIYVKLGVLQKEAMLLNEKFFKLMKTGLPFVGIKLAQTLDSRIADIAGKSKWITSEAARKETHRLRSEYDAVLVGANTVRKDDPELTVRLVVGRNPVRVVIDGLLSLSTSHKIFRTTDAPTWVLTSTAAMKSKNTKIRKLASQGIRVLGVSTSPVINAESILRSLAAEGISSVLVEGGARTAAGFIGKSLADKLYLFIAPKVLGGGLEAFHLYHPKLLRKPLKLKITDATIIGGDVFVEAKFHFE